MKKILLAILFLCAVAISKAQVVKATNIVIYKTQASLPAMADTGDIAYCRDLRLTFSFDGAVWLPSSRTVVKKSMVTINGKNTGSTVIYTLENSSLNFYPIMLVPRVVNISGVTTAPTISIGSNASSYNNIASSSLLSSVLATLSVGSGAPYNASYSPALAGGTVIYANVSIGAIATNYNVQYDIVGYYY